MERLLYDIWDKDTLTAKYVTHISDHWKRPIINSYTNYAKLAAIINIIKKPIVAIVPFAMEGRLLYRWERDSQRWLRIPQEVVLKLLRLVYNDDIHAGPKKMMENLRGFLFDCMFRRIN